MKPIFEERCFVSAGEANPEQQLSLPVLVAKFIDIATAHANSLGIGNPSMKDLHAGWVLSRVTVEMDSYPSVNDDYVVSTWISSFNRHFSEREFMVSSPDGRIYGYARTIWMVMSIIDHTNVGLGHFNISHDLIPGSSAPIARQGKHMPICLPEEVEEAPKGALVADAPAVEYRFKYSDLDSYRHVNTVRYVNLLMNRFSLEEHDSLLVKRMELSFLHEAKYDMEVQILRYNESTHKSSFLMRSAHSQNLLFAKIELTERGNQ